MSNTAYVYNQPVTVCPAGTYASGGTITDGSRGSNAYPAPSCPVCAPGYVSGHGSTACTPCPANSYADSLSTSCVACPAGTASQPFSFSPTACTCISGYGRASFASDGAAVCAPCVELNTYSNGSACLACPVGATSPPLSAGLDSCICGSGAPPSATGCPAEVHARSPVLGEALGSSLGGLALLLAALAAWRYRRREAAFSAFVLRSDELVFEEPLGSGGYGKVYVAVWKVRRGGGGGSGGDEEVNCAFEKVFYSFLLMQSTRVAAKVLHDASRPPLQPATFLQRAMAGAIFESAGSSLDGVVDPEFRHEMQVLGRLRHPNVVIMYGVVLAPHTTLVMELGAAGRRASPLACVVA